MPQTNQPKIFISHSWEDKPLVQRLEKKLQAAGAEVWVDHEGIRGGDNLPKLISDALGWCNTLLLIWSKSASKSHWVEEEWSNAVSLKKAIIPCPLDNTPLPPILTNKTYVPFSNVEAGLSQLLHDLRLNKPALSVQTPQVVEPPTRVIHSPLQEAVQPAPIVKPSSKAVLRLRSTPATLSGDEVKAMLRKYDYHCKDFDWNKDWSNPQGKGIAHQYELQQYGQVVFDHATGLMWQQGGSSEYMVFKKSEEYVRATNAQRFAGFNDWRLPTLEEAMSLMERKKKESGLYIDAVFDRAQTYIVTADKSPFPHVAWYVLFYAGDCRSYNDITYSSYYGFVRAVRATPTKASTKPIVEDELSLRSTPATLSEADVKAKLPEAARPAVITKPSVGGTIRLRSTPAELSAAEVKAMLRKYDFYCKDVNWSKEWSNSQGKGIDNKFEPQPGGLVVIDHRTGLMWQKGGSSENMSLAKVEEYVRATNAQRFAGFNDWRLPTLEEAMSLMEHEEKAGGMYIDSMFDFTQIWIWTADKSGGPSYWVAYFYYGYCNYPPAHNHSHVRLVR